MSRKLSRIAFYTLIICAVNFTTLSTTGCTKTTEEPNTSSGSNGGTGSGSGSGCTSVQCHGITQAGARCLRMTNNCSGYCWQHQ